MANLNIRIDDSLKNKANNILKELNISKTQAIISFFKYIIVNKKLPMNYVNDEDLDLLNKVKHRIKKPGKHVKVNIDEL